MKKTSLKYFCVLPLQSLTTSLFSLYMYVIANPNPDAIQSDVNACSKVNVKSSEMWLCKNCGNDNYNVNI